jgi:hypothetical protein
VIIPTNYQTASLLKQIQKCHPIKYPITTSDHLWFLQNQFFVSTTLSQPTFMQHLYEPGATLRGRIQQSIKILPSSLAQPGPLGFSFHYLCPKRDIISPLPLPLESGPASWLPLTLFLLLSLLRKSHPGERCSLRMATSQDRPLVVLSSPFSMTSLLLFRTASLTGPCRFTTCCPPRFLALIQCSWPLQLAQRNLFSALFSVITPILHTLDPRTRPFSPSNDKSFSLVH